MREIELKPSRLLGVLLAGMTALALLAIALAVMPAGAKWTAALAVVGLAARGARGIWHGASLRIAPDGGVQARDSGGEWRDAEVRGDSFVSPALTVLRYRVEGGPVRSLVLLVDSAAADDLRRLRVSLRWARRTRSDTSSPGAG